MAEFNLTLNELERGLLMYALGSIHAVPGSVPLARRIASLVNGKPSPRTEGDLAPAVMGAAPVDSSQPARSSAPITDPDVIERTFRADSIEKVGKRLILKWPDRDKILQASCWDAALFPAVLSTVTRQATYLIKAVKKGNATYLNVVGVK